MEDVIGNFGVVEGAGTTVVHPIGLMMLLIAGFSLVFLPRRYAIWAFIVLVCFVSSRQAISLGGFNLYFPRAMVLIFGLSRGALRGEIARIRWNRLDSLVVAYGAWYFLSGTLNWLFDVSVMKERTGYASELVGTYLMCRMLLVDFEDVRTAILGFSIAATVLVVFFFIEYTTGRNLFSVFGGVPEVTSIREGRLRCQGAFSHPIIAGVFWAAVMPLMIAGLVGNWPAKMFYFMGLITSVGIVILSASSTPILGVTVGLTGWCIFRWRHFARYGFGLFGALLVILHMIMKAPVWALIQRINITSGNSGYHRYILVDGFITHFNEWWFLGSSVGTAHWGHFTFDTANQFVAAGVASGLLGLTLFVAATVSALTASGRVQTISPSLGWGLGISIFVICVCFLGISIWAQLHFCWTFLFAIAGSLGFKREASHVSTAIFSEKTTLHGFRRGNCETVRRL